MMKNERGITQSLSLTTGAMEEVPYLTAERGRWRETGFLITLSSLMGPSEARTDNLCSSCTMSPENLELK